MFLYGCFLLQPEGLYLFFFLSQVRGTGRRHNPDTGTGFVNHIDRIVRQKTARQVPVRQPCRGLEGVFSQTVGSTPIGDFTTQQYSIYLQDLWSAAPGLDILLGLRYEYEHRDKDAIRLAEAWLQLTGISNKAFNERQNKWSPRFGVVWDVGGQHRWLIQGGSGIYHNLVEPDVFGEAVSHSKGVEYRKGVGALGSWPEAPDATVAPVLGPRLSMLGTTFKAPRTARSSLGFVRLFGGGASLIISGTYRHPDYLSRRHDLNLPLSPVTSD